MQKIRSKSNSLLSQTEEEKRKEEKRGAFSLPLSGPDCVFIVICLHPRPGFAKACYYGSKLYSQGKHRPLMIDHFHRNALQECDLGFGNYRRALERVRRSRGCWCPPSFVTGAPPEWVTQDLINQRVILGKSAGPNQSTCHFGEKLWSTSVSTDLFVKGATAMKHATETVFVPPAVQNIEWVNEWMNAWLNVCIYIAPFR